MDMLNEWLKDSPDRARTVAEESLIEEVSETVWTALKQSGMTGEDLAKELGISMAELARQLDGTDNMTLRTLANIAFKLGARISIGLLDLHQANLDPSGSHTEPGR